MANVQCQALQLTVITIISFLCCAAIIDYKINDTFKDNLQKINNMIQLEKFRQKTIAVLHTILCAVFQ